MAVRLSALCASCPSTPRRSLILIPVRCWVNPRAIVQLEELGQLKNPVTSRTEPMTYRSETKCFDQLCYYMPTSITVHILTCRSKDNSKMNFKAKKKKGEGCGLDWSGLAQGPAASPCNQSNKILGSIGCWEYGWSTNYLASQEGSTSMTSVTQ
jgi:hypothetical protein